MKRFTTHEVVTYLGMAATILLMLTYMTGCSMKFYKAPKDVRQCCERVSAQAKEKSAQQAVGVCKFVFRVETDEHLISAGDSQDSYQARFYILDGTKGSEKPAKAEERFEWRNPLPCDPAEFACEEF